MMENIKQFNKGQIDVMEAFGDAIKVNRTAFMTAGVDAIEDVITSTVVKAFESVNHLDGAEADELRDHLISEMREFTRRGLQRAIKGIAKQCEGE